MVGLRANGTRLAVALLMTIGDAAMNARFAPAALRHPLDFARQPDDLRTRVFACIIHEARITGRRPLIRGLAEDEFQQLLSSHFPGLRLENGESDPGLNEYIDSEFTDLVHLLHDHRAGDDAAATWLAYAVASAAMGENHLWQDMGLPSRQPLSQLMREHFTELAAKNIGDMKWKKFFYRQLCERAEVPICKSPHCAACVDYSVCFDHET